MTIADQSDVEALLLRPLTASEETYIAALLTQADAVIADHLPNVRFTSQLLNQVASLRGSGSTEIWLPGSPVIAVDSLSLDGVVLDPATDYDWSEWGDVARLPAGEIWPRASIIAVTWDYGLPAPPEAVVGVAADMVRWAITNPTGVRQESIGQFSQTLTVGGYGLTDEHKKILNRYRYPVTI